MTGPSATEDVAAEGNLVADFRGAAQQPQHQAAGSVEVLALGG